MINQVRIFEPKFRDTCSSVNNAIEQANRFVRKNNAQNAHFDIDYDNQRVTVTYSIENDTDEKAQGTTLNNLRNDPLFVNPTTEEKIFYLVQEAVDAKESCLNSNSDSDYEMTLIHLKEADEWCQEAIQDVKKRVKDK